MKKVNIIVCLAVSILFASGCNSWLDVKPVDRQTADELFATKDGFWGAVNGVYTKLASTSLYGRTLSYEMIEILAKRYSIPVTSTRYNNINNYAYSDVSVAYSIRQLWEQAYATILACNVIIEQAEIQKSMLGTRDYHMIKGEMLAVRAFLHFDLLRLFGPIYTVNPEGLAIPYNNSAEADLYEILPAKRVLEEYLLPDVAVAEELLLASDPVIENGPQPLKTEAEIEQGIANTYRYRQVRFNYYALLAFKARVYLYMGDAANALTAANSLILDPRVKEYFPPVAAADINANTANPDRMFACESLFGLYHDTRNTIFKDYFDPESSDNLLLQPRANYIYGTSGALFMDMTGDYRRLYQWGIPGTPTNQNPMLLKYKDITNKELFTATFVPLIRMAEVYLIAAEADAVQNGTPVNGLAVLNDFRAMRGSGITTATSVSALQTQIMYEYAREFYGEGQAFYYFKRRNVNIPNICNGFASSTQTLANRPDRVVLPLPENETSAR